MDDDAEDDDIWTSSIQRCAAADELVLVSGLTGPFAALENWPPALARLGIAGGGGGGKGVREDVKVSAGAVEACVLRRGGPFGRGGAASASLSIHHRVCCCVLAGAS